VEQVPTTSSAKEKQPVGPLKNGHLDDVFSIFKHANHRTGGGICNALDGCTSLPRRGKFHVSIPGCLPLLNADESRISSYSSETLKQKLSKQIFSQQTSTSSSSRTSTYNSPIPTHNKFLDYNSKPTAIDHITASAFGASASTCSTSTVRRLKSLI